MQHFPAEPASTEWGQDPLQSEETLAETQPLRVVMGRSATTRQEEIPATTTEPADVTTLKRPTVKKRQPLRITSTLVLAGTFVIVNLVVQLYRRQLDVLGDTYGGLQRVQRCESLGRAPDALYLGSSRVVFGVSPLMIDQAVQTQFGASILTCNAGAVGSTFAEDYYTLKRVIEDGFAPKLVVEDLFEFNLNVHGYEFAGVNGVSDPDRRPLPDQVIQSLAGASDAPLPVFHYDSGVGNGQAQPLLEFNENANFLAEKLIPLYGTRVGLLKWVCQGSHIGPCDASFSGIDPENGAAYARADARGWVPYPTSTLTNQPTWVRTHHYEHFSYYLTGQLYHYTVGGHQLDYLQKLIALAQQHHIRVALVSMPLHAYFRTYLSSDQWNQITTLWQTTAAQFQIPYYDLHAVTGYQDRDFYDPAHLSATGAQKYATWLASTVVGPMLS